MISRAAASVVLALGMAAACSGGGRGDVVLVTLDTFRADRMGCYGNRSGLTPHLDALAARSVVFEDASAPVPITLPSHASLFTGRYPTSTGVRNNGTFVLPASETTLAEVLSKAGWSTAAVVASYPLHSRYGLAQGFETYDQDFPQPDLTNDGTIPIFFSERDAHAVTDRALEIWGRSPKGPRFLWVHYFDAHAPYAPPEPFRSNHAGAPYDGEIAFVDSEAGRLLERIRRDSPRAVVVVVGDHGESLGEHGEKTHGVFVYQSTIHVPFLLSAPGLLDEGKRVRVPVSLVDVLPTVAALVGLEPPKAVEGADLRNAIRSRRAPARPVYAESYLPRLQFRFSELTMLRRGPLKWIDAPSSELFDVAQDPGETRNLAGGHPEETAVREALGDFTRSADPAASQRAAGGLDAEAEAKLRSLGYASAGTLDRGRGEGRGRDPKEMVAYLQRYDQAVGLIAAARFDEGTAILRELIPQAPENFMARYQLAAGLFSAGRLDDAERELRTVLADAPSFTNGYLMLAEAQARLGKIDAAVASYRAAASASPGLADPVLALGRFLESVGRFEPAGEAYLAALRLEPDDPEIPRRLLALRGSRGEADKAVEELRAVLAEHPRAASSWSALASALRRLGDATGAAAAVRRAAALAPDRPDVLLQLAEVQLASNQAELAEASFRRVLALAPDRPDARLGLARALRARGRSGEAVSAVNELLAARPPFAAAHTLRGRLLEDAGRLPEAADAYRTALRLNPSDAEAMDGVTRLGGVR